MKTTVRFLFSTLVAAAAMTSTAWAEGTAIDTTKFYINEAYSGEVVGEDLGNGKYWGVNAFSSLGEAIENKTSDTKEFVVESDIDGDSISSLGGVKVTTSVENGVTISNVYGDWVYVSGNAQIGAGVTINSGYYFYYGTNTIDGKLVASGQNYQGYDNVTTVNVGGFIGCNGEAFIIRYNSENGSTGGFKLIGDAEQGALLKDREAQMHGSYYSFYSGTIDASDTLITGGKIDMVNTTDGSSYVATVNLDNTIWASTGNLVMTGNATINLSNGSVLSVVNHDNYAASSLDATSKINATGSSLSFEDLNNSGEILLNNSTLSSKSISGSGRIVANGAVDLMLDSLKDTRLFVGRHYDENGNKVMHDDPSQRSTVNLYSVSGNGINISSSIFNFNNADLILNDKLSVTVLGESYVYMSNTRIDLNGNDMNVAGKFVFTGVDLVGEGVITLSGKDQPCWQTYASSIGAGVTLEGAMQFTIYEDLTVNGKLINEGKSGNGPTHVGFNDDFWTDGAVLTVSGESALVSQTGGAGVQIHGADAKQGIEASKVVVENGATVDWAQAGTVTNNGTIEVRDATFKAASVVGNGLLLGNGAVNLSIDSSSTQVLVGGYYDAEGNRQYNDGEALRSTLVLDDVSGNGVMIKEKEFRVNNADITLDANVTADLGNGVFFYLRESNLNLNGKNLTVDGGKLVTSNLELSGTGTVTITGKTEMPCWQGNNNVVGEDVTVNSGIQINVYGALTVYGTLNTAETGHGNGADRIGYTPWNSTHDAVLILSGEKASYTQSGNYGLVIDGKNNGLIVENGASVSLGGGTATNNGIISIDGSSFSAAGTIVNNYYLLVQNGASLSAGKIVNNNSFDIYNSTLENQTISGSGYVYAENALLNNISVSGNTVYMMGTNVNGGTFATVYNGYGVVNGEWQTAGDTESVISGNVVAGSWYDYGKTTVASGATVTATNFYAQGTNGATIDGTVEVSGIFRGYNGTISESGKVVAGTAVHLYGNTINQREYNIKGELIASNDGNHASVFEVGSAYVKQYYGDNGEYWSIGGANTVVNVSGSVTLKAGEYGAANARVNVDEEGYKATLNITDGGSVVVEGTLTNNGFINVDGGTLTAVTIVNNGSITLNNATFNVTNLTGTGTLTMLGKSEVKDESGSAGVEVESIVVKTESNAVALSSSVGTIVFGGVQEVTETANTEITTLAANESVVIAWHFDVSGIESGESVTIETTIKTGLNDSEIKIFHKGDEVGAEWTEADVSDVNYDATTGKLSFKANSFSSYAVAVPEPSMFGLFAGLGALLLVGTRRRRR